MNAEQWEQVFASPEGDALSPRDRYYIMGLMAGREDLALAKMIVRLVGTSPQKQPKETRRPENKKRR